MANTTTENKLKEIKRPVEHWLKYKDNNKRGNSQSIK